MKPKEAMKACKREGKKGKAFFTCVAEKSPGYKIPKKMQ